MKEIKDPKELESLRKLEKIILNKSEGYYGGSFTAGDKKYFIFSRVKKLSSERKESVFISSDLYRLLEEYIIREYKTITITCNKNELKANIIKHADYLKEQKEKQEKEAQEKQSQGKKPYEAYESQGE
jgi:hypothetical protein